MSEFLLFHIKFSIGFVVLFSFFHFTLKKERFFTVNRYILIIMIPVIAIISTINIAPNITENITWYQFSNIIVASNDVESSVNDLINNKILIEETKNNLLTEVDLFTLIKFFYFTVSCIILIMSIISIFLLVKRLKNAKIKYKLNNKILVVTIENNTLSYSFLNWIVLPDNLSEEEEIIVLNHEIAHIEHKHSLDIFLKILIYSAFWYNPLIYVWGKCLVTIHEYQADQKAIQTNGNVINYLKIMLRFTSISNTNLLTSNLKSSSIKERFKMIEILKNQRSTSLGTIIFKYSTLTFLLLTMAFMISCNNNSIEYNLKDTVPYHNLTKVPERISKEINEGNNSNNPLWKNIELTEEAVKKGIKSAYVIVSYNIYPDGNINDVKIYKGRINQGDWSKKIGYGLDEKAIELVKQSGKYTPGEVNGKKVKVNFRIPIYFGDYNESEGYKPPSIIATPGSNFGNLIFVQNVSEGNYPKINTAEIIKLLKKIRFPEEAIKENKGGMVKVKLLLNKNGEIEESQTSAQKNDFGMQQAVIQGLKHIDKFNLIHNEITAQKGGPLRFKIYFAVSEDWFKEYWKL